MRLILLLWLCFAARAVAGERGEVEKGERELSNYARWGEREGRNSTTIRKSCPGS